MIKKPHKFLAFLCILCMIITLLPNVIAVDMDTYSISTNVENIEVSESSVLPSYYNGVELGYVTPVKNQTTLNTCWAFAGNATLESYLLKNGYGTFDFSEEHINIWATPRNNDTGWTRDYFGAGYHQMTPGYFTSFNGTVLESDLPYKTYPNGDMGYEDLQTYNSSFGVTDIMYIENDIETVKNSIYENGAVYGNCVVNSIGFNDRRTAYYSTSKRLMGQTLSGHVVTVVGWDDNYSLGNFHHFYRPENNGAWLVKNSWGDTANDNGYFWISYEDEYLFSRLFGHSYTIKGVEEIDDFEKLYQHDDFGAIYNMTVRSSINPQEFSNDLTFINVFDFSDQNRTLNKVIFESESIGSDYKVYVTPIENDEPVEDKETWTLLSTGTIDYKGYHSVDINNFNLPLEKCGIAVEIDSTNNNLSYASIGISETLFNSSSNRFVFFPDPEENDGFIMIEDSMYEFLDFYKSYNNDYENTGNIVIKALTSTSTITHDANGDFDVDILDLLAMQKYIAQLLTPQSPFIFENADADKNGDIAMTDCILLQKSLANI